MNKKFRRIYIEITNVCNLSCCFCPTTKRHSAFMDIRDFRHILAEISPWTDYIYLHVKGEPLLHPQLDQFLEATSEYGIHTNITTNGTLLEKTKAILLKYTPRLINISLHSFEANTKLPDNISFDEYVDQTLRFARAYSQQGGIACLRLWNLEPDKMTLQQKDRNSFILKTLEREFDLPEAIDYRKHLKRNLALAENIYLSFDHEFQWPAMDAPDFGSHGSCKGMKTHIAILCDGTVVPCCLDGEGVINLGNILKEPLKKILESDRSKAITSGFQNHIICEELCRRCGYRTRF